jgi:hypothetical protein
MYSSSSYHVGTQSPGVSIVCLNNPGPPQNEFKYSVMVDDPKSQKHKITKRWHNTAENEIIPEVQEEVSNDFPHAKLTQTSATK